MSLTRQLAKQIVDQKQICFQNKLNWTPNASRLRAMRRRFYQNLEDASTYKSIDLSGTRVLKYLDGNMGLDPFTRKDTLYLNFHLVPPNFSHRDLAKDLARFLEFFETHKTLPFNVITHPGQQGLERRLIKIGAEAIGFKFIGNIQQGLDYLKTLDLELPQEMLIIPMNFKSDFNSFMRIWRECKRHGLGTLGQGQRLELEGFQKHIETLCKTKCIWLIKKGRSIIGFVGVSIKDQKTLPLVSIIGVSVKYQNQGFSHILEHHTLTHLKSQGFKNYTAFTNTTQILNRMRSKNKASDRKIMETVYKLQ